jgi:hypothetical protein
MVGKAQVATIGVQQTRKATNKGSSDLVWTESSGADYADFWCTARMRNKGATRTSQHLITIMTGLITY